MSKFGYLHNTQVSVNNDNIFSEASKKKLNSTKIKETFRTIDGLRNKHPKNALLRYLNVNSLRNKFEFINELTRDTFDIFLVTKSKLDPSVSENRFSIPCYRII